MPVGRRILQFGEHLVDQAFAAAFDAPPVELFGLGMVECDGFKDFLNVDLSMTSAI
jgi:hypothetical protein